MFWVFIPSGGESLQVCFIIRLLPLKAAVDVTEPSRRSAGVQDIAERVACDLLILITTRDLLNIFNKIIDSVEKCQYFHLNIFV